MKWFGFIGALFGCGSGIKSESTGKVNSGPFEIRWEVESSRPGAWSDNGGNMNELQSTSFFSVYFRGKQIEIPHNKEKGRYFWQAVFLKDAEKPALLVGKHSM